MLRPHLVFALALPIVTPPAPPREASSSNWPVSRFVENLSAHLRENPDDAGAHYTLGRVHAFSFALEKVALLGGASGRGVWLKDFEDQQRADDSRLPRATPSEQLEHLVEGVRHLRSAYELQDSPRHRLTFAWLLETGSHLADRVDTMALLGAPPPPEATVDVHAWIDDLGSADITEAEVARRALSEPQNLERALQSLQMETCSPNPRRQQAIHDLLQSYWIERSITEYWYCFDLAMKEELGEEYVTVKSGEDLESLVVHEALESYRRLLKRRGARTPAEEANLAEAERQWKLVEAKPRSYWITPMILSLDGCPTLPDLLTPHLTVPFDLDGDAIVEPWPWVAPSTGFLVWDPEQRGEITSGQQLFGSASGWLFFPDGYRVLDAFDDDRDHRLTGPELTGIAVWFDRNTNGVSDRGEVLPVEDLGIVALATESTERIGPSLGNPCGLELADGRVLPTYDWVLERVAP